MEEPQLELQPLGRGILDTFKALAEKPWNANKNSNIPSKRRVSAEEERFRLWARSLGLNQAGHASLDYRVRDASVIRASLADLLTELKDHLENLASIILGDRLPLERDIETRRLGEAAPSDTASSDDEASLPSLSSAGSFEEADFRLASVTTRLDSLYKLAARIRSPRSRPQRPTKDLYKHVPESQRAEYVQDQEQIEVSLVAYVQRQQLLERVTDEQLQELGFSQEQLLQEYAAATHWLVRRAGIANARRKQQFVYWRKHAELLGRDMTEVPLPVIPKELTEAVVQPHAPTSVAGKPVPSVSMATSATRIDLDILGLEDIKSVISSHSRVSTIVNPKGEGLAWPLAPSHLAGSRYFCCPYCGILCPARYLSHDEWRIHQIHDLQPYHCTYEDCTDSNRLYGLRQEWIDHENQHRRVWHCHVHEEEFETQPDYMQHLHDKRLEHMPEDSSIEMVAAVVGASSKPHRDCPFCPTPFPDVATMQRHVRYHLERLALYVLPDAAEPEGGELASVRSSDSHQVVENRGRQDSVTCDFTEEEEQSFLEISCRSVDGSQEPNQPRATREDIQEFAARLGLLQVSTAMSDDESIMKWRANSRQTVSPIGIGKIPDSSRPESGSSISAKRVVNAVEPLEESKETELVLGEDHPDTLNPATAATVAHHMAEMELFNVEAEMASSLHDMSDEDLRSFAELHEDPANDDQIELYIYIYFLIFERTHSTEHLEQAIQRTEGWIAELAMDHPDRARRFRILDMMSAWRSHILVQDRITGQINEENMSVYVRLGIRLLYKGLKSRDMENKRIRKLLKSLSVKQGKKFDDPASKEEIEKFIEFHGLDMSEVLLPLNEFKNFNEFFYRALKPGSRPCSAPDNPRIVVSPADCRSVVFNTISQATKIWVKGREFNIKRLFGDAYPEDASRYEGGALGIFRLAPQDYHRFHIPVDGVMGNPKTIEGEYYTVNPMAIRSALDVYGENVRILVPIESEYHGRVMVICVGAMMVGSTVITRNEGEQVHRAEELGYFKFGGSTVLLLFEPGRMRFDDDLVDNASAALETLVRVGMSIGHSPMVPQWTPDMRKDEENITEAEKRDAKRRIQGNVALQQSPEGSGDDKPSSNSIFISPGGHTP